MDTLITTTTMPRPIPTTISFHDCLHWLFSSSCPPPLPHPHGSYSSLYASSTITTTTTTAAAAAAAAAAPPTTTTAGNPKLPNMSVRARPQPPCCVPQVWGSPQRAAAWPRKIVVKAANGWPTARPTCERLCSTRPPTAGTTNSWWIIAYLPWPYLPVAS